MLRSRSRSRPGISKGSGHIEGPADRWKYFTNFDVRHVQWAADEAQTTLQKQRTRQSSFSQLCGRAATGSRAPTSRVCCGCVFRFSLRMPNDIMTTYTSKALFGRISAQPAPLFSSAAAFSDYAQPETSGVNGGNQSCRDYESTFLWRPEHIRNR